MISIKSFKEIEKMKIAGQVVAAALELVRQAAIPGVTTRELDAIAEAHIRKENAIPTFKGVECPVEGGIDFPASACISVNDVIIHGIPGSLVLKDGDIVSVDIGACLNGYNADAARTFAVGEISEQARKLIEATEKSFFEGISKAVAGNRIVDISAAVQEYAESQGFSVVRDYVGHGIGTELWEPPQIPNYVTKNKGPRLEKGMTLAVEPMINAGGYEIKILPDKWTVVTADGSLSAHYENTIVITDGQPEILTMLSSR